MKVFEKAKWIWLGEAAQKDEYAEFLETFNAEKNPTVCRLSCDGDYTLFVNGRYAASNQYGDFEHYKIYDEIDLTPYLSEGENEIFVLVWHFGENTQRYISAKAGLIFEIAQGERVLTQSGERTLCRKSPTYQSHRQKQITVQLGFGFSYDATKETSDGYVPATPVEKNCTFYPRPIKKLEVQERVPITVLKNEGNYYLIDLGEETVGLCTFEFISEAEQKLRVEWGEDLQNGHVRRIIGARDFSFEYVAKKGKNEYTNYMLRLGCRYLEIYAENSIELQYAGLLPQIYPVRKKAVKQENALDQKIYDLCVNTLERCLMEHYVDTPWREQCLYVFDARNQMLCGYYAFEGGNAEYARANLKLIGVDCREDGLLSICYPCGIDLTIPSFSLYYFLSVWEYTEYTGDCTLAEEVFPKLISLTEAFVKARKEGLVCKFEGENHWNFYDWSPYLDGDLHGSEEAIPDLMINVLFIFALENLRRIALRLGREFLYADVLQEAKIKTKAAFYHSDEGVFSILQGGNEYTVLGNSLAVLAGLTDENESRAICEKIARGELCECSLSMKTFKYDALLATDKAKWKGQVLDEIQKDYEKMLTAGATTVWETIEGAEAFENAGSLCHGWSAIPIYYYHMISDK